MAVFKQVPIQVWLLLAIGATAYVPACYVLRYLIRSPARRDITQPSEDFSWRSSGQFMRSLAILLVLAALAVFIFTPAARQLAHSPSFWPILVLAFGGWALFTVAKGFSVGSIEPFVRGANYTFRRHSQPKRFWASMGWNGLLGCLFIWLGFWTLGQAPLQGLRDRCYHRTNKSAPREELAACNELIGKQGKGAADFASLIGARGSAYYRMGDYQHAEKDYTEAIRLDPGDSSSHYNLGLVDNALGYRGLARDDFSAAIRADGSNAEAYFERGSIFLGLGKLDQAVADFSKANELRPNDAMTLASRGIAHAWKRDEVRAEQDFASARMLDPSNIVVPRGEAILSIDRGDLNGAVRHLTEALSRDAGDMWSLAMRAEAYRRLGMHEEMEADKRLLRRLDKNSQQTTR